MQKTKSTDYISLRKNLLEQVKSKVQIIEGTTDSELKDYFKPYKSDLHDKNWFPVQRSELIEDILSCEIVIGGDFHAFAQSQRTHLRIIRSLKKLDKPLVLALECFESSNQQVVNDYLSGKIDEAELSSLTNWEQNWGFPFKNYLPLIRYAKSKSCDIIAINYKSKLAENNSSEYRDRHIAEQIMTYKKNNKDCLVYVVIGDLHISTPHLPQSIKNIDGSIKILSIFQNSEKLYFDLIAKGLENKVDIMKSKDNQYCILTSPPWVKWQNYLMFLESDDFHIEEYDILFEDDEYDDEDFTESIDFTDQLFSIFSFLSVDLDLKVNFDRAEVFTELSDFLLTRFEEKLSTKEFELIREMVLNSKSFYLPELGALYLSRFTTNHASEVIGKYIQAEFAKRNKNLFNQPEDFRPLIWVETLSYFLSKIYNPKRKTMSFKALKAELLTINPQDSNHEVLKFSLGHAMNEYFSALNIDRSKMTLSPLFRPYSYIDSARILGQFKGEQLFQKYTSGLISKENIKTLLAKDVFSEDFDELYNSVIKVLLSKQKNNDKKEYIL